MQTYIGLNMFTIWHDFHSWQPADLLEFFFSFRRINLASAKNFFVGLLQLFKSLLNLSKSNKLLCCNFKLATHFCIRSIVKFEIGKFSNELHKFSMGKIFLWMQPSCEIFSTLHYLLCFKFGLYLNAEEFSSKEAEKSKNGLIKRKVFTRGLQ